MWQQNRSEAYLVEASSHSLDPRRNSSTRKSQAFQSHYQGRRHVCSDSAWVPEWQAVDGLELNAFGISCDKSTPPANKQQAGSLPKTTCKAVASTSVCQTSDVASENLSRLRT